jgi:hypothetical protein
MENVEWGKRSTLDGLPFEVHMNITPSGVRKHRVTSSMVMLVLGQVQQGVNRCGVLVPNNEKKKKKKKARLVFCSYNLYMKCNY